MDSVARASRKEVVSLLYKRFSSSAEKFCLSKKWKMLLRFRSLVILLKHYSKNFVEF